MVRVPNSMQVAPPPPNHGTRSDATGPLPFETNLNWGSNQYGLGIYCPLDKGVSVDKG